MQKLVKETLFYFFLNVLQKIIAQKLDFIVVDFNAIENRYTLVFTVLVVFYWTLLNN